LKKKIIYFYNKRQDYSALFLFISFPSLKIIAIITIIIYFILFPLVVKKLLLLLLLETQSRHLIVGGKLRCRTTARWQIT
jgi:hypothetical protein